MVFDFITYKNLKQLKFIKYFYIHWDFKNTCEINIVLENIFGRIGMK